MAWWWYLTALYSLMSLALDTGLEPGLIKEAVLVTSLLTFLGCFVWYQWLFLKKRFEKKDAGELSMFTLAYFLTSVFVPDVPAIYFMIGTFLFIALEIQQILRFGFC